jgi:hypothetical protein
MPEHNKKLEFRKIKTVRKDPNDEGPYDEWAT